MTVNRWTFFTDDELAIVEDGIDALEGDEDLDDEDGLRVRREVRDELDRRDRARPFYDTRQAIRGLRGVLGVQVTDDGGLKVHVERWAPEETRRAIRERLMEQGLKRIDIA